MRITIHSSSLSGKIVPPPSEAHAVRALWVSCLGAGGVIENCPDTRAVRTVLEMGEQMGADIEFEMNPELEQMTADIFGPGEPDISRLKECPTLEGARLAIPLACIQGRGSFACPPLPKTPQRWLDRSCAGLGVHERNEGGKLLVSGEIKAEELELKDLGGAFFANGWILGLPLLGAELALTLDDFTDSRPGVRMSIELLKRLGISLSYEEENLELLIASGQEYGPMDGQVEEDWRAGSYYLGALMLAGSGEVWLPSSTMQPEKTFWERLGAGLAESEEEEAESPIRWDLDGTAASADNEHRPDLPSSVDLRPFPSLLPLAMAMATQNDEPVCIEPLYPVYPNFLARARHMAAQLNAIGGKVSASDTSVSIEPSELEGGHVDSAGDDKIAMALALAGLVCKKELVIENAQAVERSDSDFWAKLRLMGARIKAQE